MLDEIHLVQDFEGVINGFMRIPNVDIYITGCNSKFLSSDIITEFRGRGNSEINKLTDMVASSNGSLTNPTKLVNTFSSEKKNKISVNTVTSRKIIIVNEPILTGHNEYGILVVSLSDFLLAPEKTLNY